MKGKLVIASYCTGCANKNNPLEKLLYINNNSTSLSQTFAVYVRVCTQHILQISLKQLIWFKRYNSLNFKVHFFKWTCSRALNIHEQTLHNFSSTVQTFQWWMSAARSVFKQSVQNVHPLQQHMIEVFCEMIRLPYQWTSVANHSTSPTKQSSAR